LPEPGCSSLQVLQLGGGNRQREGGVARIRFRFFPYRGRGTGTESLKGIPGRQRAGRPYTFLEALLECRWVGAVQRRDVLDPRRQAQLVDVASVTALCQVLGNVPEKGFAALVRLAVDVNLFDAVEKLRPERLAGA